MAARTRQTRKRPGASSPTRWGKNCQPWGGPGWGFLRRCWESPLKSLPPRVVEHAFWSRGAMLLASQMMLLGYQKSTGWSSKALLPLGLRIGLLAVGTVFLDDIVLVGLLDLQANEQRLGVLLGGGVNLNLRSSSPECRCKVTTSAKRFQIFAVFLYNNFH